MPSAAYDPHISVERIGSATDSTFVLKEITLDHQRRTFEAPFKVLDGTDVSRGLADTIVPSGQPDLIYESGRYIHGHQAGTRLHALLDASASERVAGLDGYFSLKKKLWNSALTTLSVVFQQNPFAEQIYLPREKPPIRVPALDSGQFECLLDYIHAASSAAILCPDIRFPRDSHLSVTEYCAFVDTTVAILSTWNTKPIFVPIQPDFSRGDLQTILKHYRQQGYSNIWVNFNARSCDNTYASNLRVLRRETDRWMAGMDYLLYFSHIKREILAHLRDDNAPASDVLTQFHGADLIGITREPFRMGGDQSGSSDDWITSQAAAHGFATVAEYQEAQIQHKHRIFDPETYYYQILAQYRDPLPIDPRSVLTRPPVHRLLNSVLVQNEIANTRDHVAETRSLKEYLGAKEALRSDPHLLDSVLTRSPSRQASLFQMLGYLGQMAEDLSNDEM